MTRAMQPSQNEPSRVCGLPASALSPSVGASVPVAKRVTCKRFIRCHHRVACKRNRVACKQKHHRVACTRNRPSLRVPVAIPSRRTSYKLRLPATSFSTSWFLHHWCVVGWIVVCLCILCIRCIITVWVSFQWCGQPNTVMQGSQHYPQPELFPL